MYLYYYPTGRELLRHLVKICNEKLECAERRVRILTEGADGVITDMPFDSGDEA